MPEGRISAPQGKLSQHLQSRERDCFDKCDDYCNEKDAQRQVSKKSSKSGNIRISNVTTSTRACESISSPQRHRNGSAKQ